MLRSGKWGREGGCTDDGGYWESGEESNGDSKASVVGLVRQLWCVAVVSDAESSEADSKDDSKSSHEMLKWSDGEGADCSDGSKAVADSHWEACLPPPFDIGWSELDEHHKAAAHLLG